MALWNIASYICCDFFLLVGIWRNRSVPTDESNDFMLTLMTCLFISRVFLWDDLQWQSVGNDPSHKSYYTIMKSHYESWSHLTPIRGRSTAEGITWQRISLLWAAVTRGALQGVPSVRERAVLSWLHVCVSVRPVSHVSWCDGRRKELPVSSAAPLKEKQQLFFLLMWEASLARRLQH